MSDWNPHQYLRFSAERIRAANDLLGQVSLAAPERIYDLGCGPGNSTELLIERYPRARVTGVDNSPNMLAAARKALPGIEFHSADLASWMPPEPADLLYSNAVFHWLPEHIPIIARLAGSLNPGGAMAIQMPDNLAEPSHALMKVAAEQGPWAGKLSRAIKERALVPPVSTYYRELKRHFARLDIWHTIYNYPLRGAAGIVDFVSGASLKPWTAPLDDAERRAYLDVYTKRLAEAYPELPDGTVLLRFPRLFIVGVK